MTSAGKGRAPTFATAWCVFKAMAARGFIRAAGVAACVALALSAGGGSSLEAQAPDENWRTIETEHFRVTFPDVLEPLARRAAARAESARARLAEAFLDAPDGIIDIVLSDHTDIANGNARLTPSKRIRVFAAPPVDDPNLGYFDEWIDLVITHELAHIYHLDRAGALGRFIRSIVGRYPGGWPVFPNTAAPRWTVEGLATWYESRLSDAGRQHGTFQETVLRTATLEGKFEGIDQASGDSPVWPGGNRTYLYGSEFFDFLLDKHGEDKMAAFVQALGGQWIPYRLNAAGRDAFGVSLSSEWSAWRAALEGRYEGLDRELARFGPITEPEVISEPSRVALHTRVSPDGATVAYARSDGRSDTQIREMAPDGSDSRKRTRSSGVPTFDWLDNEELIVAQFEQDGPYRVYSDLYRVDPSGGEHRVTYGARLINPTVAPDGGLVAVQGGEGTTWLARVDRDATVTPLTLPDPDVHWAYPAFSPDGRWIAASRWTPGAMLDVVVLDAASGSVITTVTNDRAVDLSAAWSPDGRWLVWGSDRTGIQNILAVPIDPGTGRAAGPVRLATNVRTAVAYPEVDPSGRWIYVSGYHADGWGIERVPFTPDAWPEAPRADDRFAADYGPPDPDARAGGPVQAYDPLRSLVPTYWIPLAEEPILTSPVRGDSVFVRSRELLGYAVGAEIGGEDLVSRHFYSASARVFVDDPAKADLGASYTWAGLGNPRLGVAFRQLWSSDGARLARPETGPFDTLFVLERGRSISGSATWLRQTIRTVSTLTASGGYGWDTRFLLDNALRPTTEYNLSAPEARIADARLTLNISRARSHAMQMGPANGPALFVRARRVFDLTVADSLSGVAGADRSVDEVLTQFRLYKTLGGPGFAAHVLALRTAFGIAGGPDADASWFNAGGSTGSPERITGLELFGGSSAFFGVRGYDRNSRSGRLAWTSTLEYRVPLLNVHRGVGAVPAYMDRVFGTVFLDAGNAWGPDVSLSGFTNERRSTLAGAGAELAADFLFFWTEPLRIRVGAAAPLVEGDGGRVYLRLGLAF